MSNVDMDHYWPMAEGPGAGAEFARWKRMAMLWSKNGVVRGRGEQLQFHGWVEPGLVAIGSGAVWLMCAYGEQGLDPFRHTWISAPGDDGMIVAVMDEGSQLMRIDYQAGFHGGDFINPNGSGQMNLWELQGFGTVIDRRRYVPDVPPPPPVTVIPDRVPGRIVTATTNFEQAIVGDGANPLVLYVGWRGDYVPNRHWRFTADLRNDNTNGSSTIFFYTGSLFVFVRDQSGVRMRFQMAGPTAGNPATQAGTARMDARVINFVVPNCWGEMLIAFEQAIGASQAGAYWRYEANCLRLEAEEIGSDSGW